MNRTHYRICALVVTLIVGAAAARAQPVRDRTVRTDVVELLSQNKERAGQPEFAATYGKFTYWFATEANMMTFLMNQEKYEVQLGGACARMGPLSGEGTTRLLAAHEGRLYLFASEQCRARFLQSPTDFLESPDQTPIVSEASRARGRAMLGKAVDAMACLAGIDNVKTYHEQLVRDVESGGVRYRITESLTLGSPDKVFKETCWNDSCWSYLVNGARGEAVSSGGSDAMHAQQIAALIRETTHPLTILWARDAKDVVISSDGLTRTIQTVDGGETVVTLVTVHHRGVTATLGLDSQSRIRLVSHRGRGPNATIGAIDRIYSGFRNVGGVNLPARVDTTFNDQVYVEQSGEFATQSLNNPEHAKLFADAVK